MKILNLGNLTLNLTTSTDNIIPTIPSGQMLSFDDTGWNNDTFTIPQNINSTVALENNSNMQIYVVDSGTDTTTMTGDIILGTNDITGTTGLIQGFNIPALDTRITTEASTRLTNDNTLQTNITAEAKSRLDADTAEASTRLTNDNTLQTNITEEAKSRLDADTAEASTRLTNDNTLQTNITAEQTSRLAEVDVERQKINTILSGASVNLDTLLEIVTAYQLADTSVLTSITGLQNADTVEASTRLTNDNTLQTNITAEAKSRLDGDSLKLNLTGGTVTGTLISSTSTLTPIIDINTTGTLSIGNTTATGITLGKTGIITTIPGNLNINGTVNLTGQVTTNQTPSAATQLVPKSYVDAGDALQLNLTGGALTGNLTSNSQIIGGGAKILTFGLNWLAGSGAIANMTFNGTCDSAPPASLGLSTAYLPSTTGTVGYYFKSVRWQFENDPGGQIELSVMFENTPFTISAATIGNQKIGTAQMDFPPYYYDIRVMLVNYNTIRTGRTSVNIGYF